MGTLIFNTCRMRSATSCGNLIYWFEEFHIDWQNPGGCGGLECSIGITCRPDGECWHDEGAARISKAVDLSAAGQHVLFSALPRSVVDRRRIHHLADGCPAHPPGGLGFNLKWNMGWMHDMLDYFELRSVDASVPPEQISFSTGITPPRNFSWPSAQR